MKKLSIVILAFLITGCGISQTEYSTFFQPKDRKIVSKITGPTLDGEFFNQSLGRVTVVNVWASWCAPCRAEAPTLNALAEKYPEVDFVGILTRDNEATAKAFVTRFGIKYPTVTDDSLLLNFRKIASANAIPTTLILDKKGRVAARISGQVTVAGLNKLIEKISNE